MVETSVSEILGIIVLEEAFVQTHYRTESHPKRLVLVNTCLYGSTGKIIRQIQSAADIEGFSTWTVTAFDKKEVKKDPERDIIVGNKFDRYLHLFLSRITGLGGFFSFFSTIRLIKIIKKINPDIIHLHNLHNAYISIPVLFRYLKNHKIKTFWTFHDCWPFTGRCPYFDITHCSRWKTGCGQNCPYPKGEYPISYVDNTKRALAKKQKCISGLTNLTIVTPSNWLANLVKESFLKKFKVEIINNGIDLSVFRPYESNSFIREKYHIKAQYIVLGVALVWNRRKGIDIFIDLVKMLDERYQIVLVGVDSQIERTLPASIICIERTNSQNELAEIYSAADVFFNPTREDNFPTVNIEAIACGTPVVTFRTGGSPEIIDETCGIVIEDGNMPAIKDAICGACERHIFSKKACVERAKKFDMNDRFYDYIELYNRDA